MRCGVPHYREGVHKGISPGFYMGLWFSMFSMLLFWVKAPTPVCFKGADLISCLFSLYTYQKKKKKSTTSMLLSTSSRLREGPTHVTDTGRCPTPCLNPIEVARLGQLSLCCSRLGTSPSSRVCSVLFPALRLSHAAVCTATELLVHCSRDLFNL